MHSDSAADGTLLQGVKIWEGLMSIDVARPAVIPFADDRRESSGTSNWEWRS